MREEHAVLRHLQPSKVQGVEGRDSGQGMMVAGGLSVLHIDWRLGIGLMGR